MSVVKFDQYAEPLKRAKDRADHDMALFADTCKDLKAITAHFPLETLCQVMAEVYYKFETLDGKRLANPKF